MSEKLLEALERTDPVFGGGGSGVALVLLLALLVLLPPGERAFARTPLWLLLGYLASVGASALIPSDFADDFIRVAALMFLLGSIGRSVFLLFANAIWVRRISTPLPKILRDVIQALIYALAGLLVLRAVGVEPGSLLTTSALLTAVIGLSLQDTLGNLFAGLAIQAQRPFAVGDWVQFDDSPTRIGRVIEINWRATRLRTLERLEVTVPNSMVAKAPLMNYSRPSLVVRREVSVVAPYHVSPDRVHHWLHDAVLHTPNVLNSPEPVVVTNDYTERGVEYLVRYFIDDFEKHENIESDVRDRLWYALKRHGITIPVPGARIELRRAAAGSEPVVDSADARARLLARLELFRGLSQEETSRLASASRRETFAPEELIVREGEDSTEMFIIQSGRVRVEAKTLSGVEVVSELKHGEFFGEMSLLTGARRAANVVASVETEVLVLDRETMSPLLEEKPELAGLISRVLAERQQALSRVQGEDRPSALEQKEEEQELLNRIRRFFHL